MHRMMMFQLYSVPGNLLPNVEQDSKCILHAVLRIEHFHFDSTLIIGIEFFSQGFSGYLILSNVHVVTY